MNQHVASAWGGDDPHLRRVVTVFNGLALLSACVLCLALFLGLANSTALGLALPLEMVAAGALAYTTATGLQSRRPWAKWAAYVQSVLLLAAFPIGTIVGAMALWFLRKVRWEAPPI